MVGFPSFPTSISEKRAAARNLWLFDQMPVGNEPRLAMNHLTGDVWSPGKPLSEWLPMNPFPSLAFLVIAFCPAVLLAADLDGLIKQLAGRDSATKVTACGEIAALEKNGLPAGGALCDLLVKEKPSGDVWQAASDALEKVAPKIHPHVLTVLLNDDKRGQVRLSAANAIASESEEGPAGLPVLKKLWSEPSNNYKQASLLRSLHAIAPTDAEVSRVIFLAARGDLNQVLLGGECRATAIRIVAERDLKEDEINEALFSAMLKGNVNYQALSILTERAKDGHADPAKVAAGCVTIIQRQAKANRYEITATKALVELGARAKSVLPDLRKLRNHPNEQIRGYIKQAIDAIEQAAAVEVPSEGDTWEVVAVNKAGTISLKNGDREATIRPSSDRTVVFDADAKPIRDGRAMMNALRTGSKVKPQFKGEKIISVQVAQ
jgi:hypothetical protein